MLISSKRCVLLIWLATTATAAVSPSGIPTSNPGLQDPAPEQQVPGRTNNPGDAPAERVKQQLQQAAVLTDRAFELSWSWSLDRRTIQRHRAGQKAKQPLPGAATGSMHEDLLAVLVTSDQRAELLQVGPRTIAKKADSDWQRVDRLEVTQGAITFVPDPRLLLRTLSECSFAATHRSIGELDGQPIEFLSLELPPESGARLHRAGVIPDPNPIDPSLRAVLERHEVDPKIIPSPVLDIAIAIDVKSKRAVAVTVRALLLPIDTRAILQAAGGRTRASEEDAAAIEAIRQGLRGDGKNPLVYRDGLPERNTHGTELRTLTYRIGAAVERPKLDERQEQMLQQR
jgi:hypothetical protein